MSNNFFIGPTPPYNNPPINAQFFQPNVFVISGVQLGVTTTVTMREDSNYVIGQLVRLLIPFSFGCRQLNEQTGYVIAIPAANQVTLDINSSQNVDAFTASAAKTQAQIIAIGDVNTGVTNANGRTNQATFIPGSFINISPN